MEAGYFANQTYHLQTAHLPTTRVFGEVVCVLEATPQLHTALFLTTQHLRKVEGYVSMVSIIHSQAPHYQIILPLELAEEYIAIITPPQQ